MSSWNYKVRDMGIVQLEKRFLSTSLYAKKMGVEPSTISNWIKRGQLEAETFHGRTVIAVDAVPLVRGWDS